MTAPALRMISSMATKKVLTELIALYAQQPAGAAVALESVGGVDAARRVATGEAFDAVVLGADALDRLVADGHVRAGSRIDIVRSDVAVAVRAGSPHPDLGSEAAVRQAVLAAGSVGYSTGPSGVALARLFERWGIADAVNAKLVTPPPGVPVGSLVASGEVALGFQQLSELMHLSGIDVVGPLPDAIQITTVFAGGVATASQQADAVAALLAFMASPQTSDIKRANGMDQA
ncbi:substrate-binding domain-containing protein [Ottowia sp.]|uniref:substrate-binding domain-containing protein n=1 Tax=Ottowia sp. TaxID=1898956 RepID=UPI002CF9943B|nr:substrate-binding domain-containing protein [Ottowia sp.]HRN74372.1 substrate-binding domain-containing protein [Ottowia sp.]HRQ01268.1 substrate-binding domain-containing protein [Ottowia sp.]